ncbi:hypothetical protein EVC29_019 [Rhizobium phage RHph_Y52]|nr:hypothetical protein EVC16_019 [Rhizobium phage RHph_Y21]QIG76720.1 hypothetical protein EVC29_019 [Rhizobium phage RHph_Y52]
MIDAPVRYRFSPGKIKLELMSTFVAKGVDILAAMECANDCVTAGKATPFWREQMGDEAADALNDDLKGMMQ